MDKCYKYLFAQNGAMNSNCRNCEYWKKSVRKQTDKTCYEYFDCKEDCPFKDGKLPSQQRIQTKKRKCMLEKTDDAKFENIAGVLAIMMNEENK